MILGSKHVGAILNVLYKQLYVCGLVGVLIKCLYELHGATIKMVVPSFSPAPCLCLFSQWLSHYNDRLILPKLELCFCHGNHARHTIRGQNVVL